MRTMFLRLLGTRVVYLSVQASAIMDKCVAEVPNASRSSNISWIRGLIVPRFLANLTSACLMPGRLLHKLLTLLIFIVRALPTGWLRAKLGVQPQVDSDLFGLLPPFSPGGKGPRMWLGYMQHEDPQTGQCTLVPLVGGSIAGRKFSLLSQHMGYKTLQMIVRDGTLVLDRGLLLWRATDDGFALSAVSGWTGRLFDSFTAAPMLTTRVSDAIMEQFCTENPTPEQRSAAMQELAARQQPDYFHIIPAIQSMVPEDDWPAKPGQVLFIATPQLGIEPELVELELLESLAEEAAAGDPHAQLLIAHIEDECNRITSQAASVDSAGSAQPSSLGAETSHPLTIADILAARRASMQRMIDEQLLIHAEAVERAESRHRIEAGRVARDASDSSASTAAGSSSSALAPTSAASSASSSSSSQFSSGDVSSASAGISSVGLSSRASTVAAVSADDGCAYSWTSAYSSLESMREPGRKKYKTITSAALRFLHTLRPVSVNRSGGSHTVFHFASGKPVTLVQPHGGDGSVSRHAATRLYAVLHEAALQQLAPD